MSGMKVIESVRVERTEVLRLNDDQLKALQRAARAVVGQVTGEVILGMNQGTVNSVRLRTVKTERS